MRSWRAPLWRQFAAEIIVTCVRWYLRFSLSLRDVEELMAERSLAVDHATIWRWAQTYAPEVQRRLRGLSQMNPARTGPMRLRLILRNSSAVFVNNTYRLIADEQLMPHRDALMASADAMRVRAGIIRDAARSLRVVTSA